MLTPKRIDIPELLDERDAPQADVERSLRDLRRFNRYAGGSGVYRRLLRRMAPDGQRLSILDIATGTADVLELAPHHWLRVGVDVKIEHLLYMRQGSDVRRVVGNALHLPFRSGAIDIVTSAHFFHHLSPEGNAAMLREALRIARRGVAVNDTRRHYVPLLIVRLLAAFRLVGRITRNDAPASILRGYTIGEVQEIAANVNARRAEVVRVWPFRFGLLLWR